MTPEGNSGGIAGTAQATHHATRRRHLSGYGAPGLAPGTLRVPANASPTTVEVHGYGGDGDDSYEVVAAATLDDVNRLADSFPNLWINVTGLADIDVIRSLAERFSLHDLALEDVFHTHQRPKAEEYPGHHFIIARLPIADDFPHTEQLAIFLGESYVMCFQEHPGDCFDPVRARLADPRTRIRTSPPCFLAYALIDAVVDSYFPLLERMGDDLEILENEVLSTTDPKMMERLHRAKRTVVELRRTIWPHREMINAVLRDESAFFDERTIVYLRDCYDHLARLIDIVETDREFVSDLFDVHLSRINLRMNEIMKVLTTIATVFIPLSFVASLYGMNFDPNVSPWNMPELKWTFGYVYALVLMLVIAGGLIYFVYRKGWLTSQDLPKRRRRRRRF